MTAASAEGQPPIAAPVAAPWAVLHAERNRESDNAAPRRRRMYRLCNAWQGAPRWESCARKSDGRSENFRRLPFYPPQSTVIELATGEDYGTWDTRQEVALRLAFSRLSIDQVVVTADQSPVASWAAWE